jgi:hypothetical protein
MGIMSLGGDERAVPLYVTWDSLSILSVGDIWKELSSAIGIALLNPPCDNGL